MSRKFVLRLESHQTPRSPMTSRTSQKMTPTSTLSSPHTGSSTLTCLTAHPPSWTRKRFLQKVQEVSAELGGKRLTKNYLGIPGLSRVLDALSTIMWPSMKATARGSSGTAGRLRERALLDWAQSSQDSDMIVEGESHLSEQRMTTRQEMRELTLWLEGDEFLRDDPWKSASSAMASASPTDEIFNLEMSDKVITGFDDDFTVFVSSPPLDSLRSSGPQTPEVETKSIEFLSLPHAGDAYRSLGSDFGSDDGMDGDEGLPTQEEIAATSRLLFGDQASGSMDSTEFSLTAGGIDGSGGAEPYELAPFDLSKVLGALQEMKAEIGMMDNEGERRKAAARVALGLVYGLEG